MADTVPPLSVIIPWSNRPEVATTLQHNRPIFARHNAEVVIVNCGGDFEQLCQVLRSLNDGPSSRGLRLMDMRASSFNKSLALNLGVFGARGACLFFLDTDILLQEDFMPDVLKLLDGRCFVTVERVLESRADRNVDNSCLAEISYHMELVNHINRKARIETNRVRFNDRSRSGPGLVLLRREHLLQVGGMNSDLKGWGWEDVDLLARLQLALGLGGYQAGTVVHVTHGDELRSLPGTARAVGENTNMVTCLANYRLGNYLGTYEEDVAKWKERTVIHEWTAPT